jgi:hypothetical protein
MKGLAISLETIHEPKSKDRDRFDLLFIVRSEHYHCFDGSRKEGTAKDKRGSGEKSRPCPACLDFRDPVMIAATASES